MDKFYTSTRYPFIIGMTSDGYLLENDALSALNYAEEIFSFVSSLLRDLD